MDEKCYTIWCTVIHYKLSVSDIRKSATAATPLGVALKVEVDVDVDVEVALLIYESFNYLFV